ncbi:MAG: hypothetical protein RIQ60_3274 [Pseudomonadota bacterium]|jgi:hypothetical protein
MSDSRPGLRRLAACAALGLALCAGLTGCSKPPGTELFPLDAGHRWTYRMVTEFETGATDVETLVLSNLGSDSLPNGAGSAMHRRSASGVDYWLRADDTGIWRVASKSDVMAEPELDPKEEAKRRYVLKAPIAVGTSWQASTTAYVLKRRSEFPPEIRHTHPKVPMSFAIDALDQKVDTRAGSFAGCVRVRGKGTVKLFVDPVAGWQDLPLTSLEWYCPGVGLVRLERSEPANSTFLVGGNVTMDLISWQ